MAWAMVFNGRRHTFMGILDTKHKKITYHLVNSNYFCGSARTRIMTQGSLSPVTSCAHVYLLRHASDAAPQDATAFLLSAS